MKILFILLMGVLLIFPACANTKCLCPNKDVVFFIYTPIGPIPVGVEKDFFNKDKEGKDWMELEKFNEMMKDEEPKEEDTKMKTI